ncbi:hypothetical protein [Nocardia sp. CA-120079]|uniref:hypothetical protein n=1 Tax=Nocardia sp. CA-120079 TaxID=3239974 RepID=UPI003D97AC08
MHARPDISALYWPIDDQDAQQQASADAYRTGVRDAALRAVTECSAALVTVPAEKTGRRIDLRGCIRAEIRRAAAHGATREQIRAALTARPADPEGHHRMDIEFVRLTLPNGNYAEWIDHGPDRPALVNLYTRSGLFAGMERTSYATDETTAQTIQRLSAAYPAAKLSRLTWDEVAPGKTAPQRPATAQQSQTGTQEGQRQC